VRYGDVYSVKFTYFDEEALQARLYQIAIQTAQDSDTSSTDSDDDGSDEGSDTDNTANEADIKCFNTLCSSHYIRDPDQSVKPRTRSLTKPACKEDIIINQELKQYFGKTVVFQGRGLNIHEDR
jgi:hypothetical protein